MVHGDLLLFVGASLVLILAPGPAILFLRVQALTMSLSAKPFAESCEENKLPILTVLTPLLADAERVLGSAAAPASMRCSSPRGCRTQPRQASGRAEALSGIRLWLEAAATGTDGIDSRPCP
jgi:hypothetical protein